MIDDERTPVYLHCRPCAYQWIAAWLPLPASTFARVMRAAHCPMCGGNKQVYLGLVPIDPDALPAATTTRPEGA